jgi:hypothetical protein
MKLEADNPFELFQYKGPEYFCDREQELELLTKAFDSRINTVLSSYRRMGKTSLIAHLHHYLSKRKGVICIYMDILHTRSDKEFADTFVTATMQALEKKEPQLLKFLDTFKNVRPIAGVNPSTGLPTLSLGIESEIEVNYTFDTIMNLIIERPEKFQITIDEFQQIDNYEQQSVMDARIRSYFPKAKNLQYIFAGSDQHLLTALFTNPKKPMFSSTQMVTLDYIPYTEYYEFIKRKFESRGRKISDLITHRILKWTNQYTFYTHFLCSNLYNNGGEEITDTDLAIAKNSCLKHFEPAYYMYRKILSKNQFKMLAAVAKDGEARNIQGKDFLNKHKLSASTAKQSLQKLVSDQLVHENLDKNGSSYFVYDMFLMRWLQQNY